MFSVFPFTFTMANSKLILTVVLAVTVVSTLEIAHFGYAAFKLWSLMDWMTKIGPENFARVQEIRGETSSKLTYYQDFFLILLVVFHLAWQQLSTLCTMAGLIKSVKSKLYLCAVVVLSYTVSWPLILCLKLAILNKTDVSIITICATKSMALFLIRWYYPQGSTVLVPV